MVVSWFKLGVTIRVQEKQNGFACPLRMTIFPYCQRLQENTAWSHVRFSYVIVRMKPL